MKVDIKANLRTVRERIERACEKARRDPSEVVLVGVTKKKPASLVLEALEAGLRDFGENYAQELIAKAREVEQLGGSPRWHFIGKLQSNKVKYLLGLVHSIHSVDRESVIRELRKRINPEKPVKIYVETNIGGEVQKGGASPDAVEKLVRQLMLIPGVELAGLMCIPPWSENPEASRPYFRALRKLRDEVRKNLGLPAGVLEGLSMGMSHDLEVAIEEGATVVRVGTAIFGPRE